MSNVFAIHFWKWGVSAILLAGLFQSGCHPIQFHTQEFGSGENNLAGKQLYFIPIPNEAQYYDRLVTDIVGLGNDPTDDSVADVSDGPVSVDLGANVINFYGTEYNTIYIGSRGTIGLGAPGSDDGRLIEHFMHAQVALLPVDINGVNVGDVTYDIVEGDSVAVTYAGVSAGGEPATAQAEFITRSSEAGDIALTYLGISADAAGVVGLSRGYSEDEVDGILASFFVGDQRPLTTPTVMTGTIFTIRE